MDSLLRRDYDAARRRPPGTLSVACHAPFVTLAFQTDGQVTACSRKPSVQLGRIPQQRLPDIWGNAIQRGMRDRLADYQFPGGCEYCEWQVRHADFHLPETRLYDTLPVAARHPEWPLRLEFNLSNRCNMACIQCSPTLSSLIRRRMGLPPMEAAYGEGFFQDLEPFLRHVEDCVFLGGEPFLQEECWRIWDRLRELPAPPVCRITTNATVYNTRVAELLESLPVSLAVSLDGVSRAVVEHVRGGARHARMMANIERFQEHLRRGPRGSLVLNFCLMRENWHELPDFMALAESLDADVWLLPVTDPSRFSLFSLPPGELSGIVSQLERRSDWVLANAPGNHATWLQGLAMLSSQAVRTKALEFGAFQTSRRPEVDSALKEAWEALAREQPQRALEFAAGCAEDSAHHYDALVLLASVRRRQGEFERAGVLLNEAIETNWPRGDAFIERAWLRCDCGQLAAAADDVERALESWGDLGAALQTSLALVAVDVYVMQGRLDRARAVIDRWSATAAAGAVDVEASFAYDELVHLARTYRRCRLWDEAQRLLARAIDLDGTRYEAYVERTWLAVDRKDPEAALRDGNRGLADWEHLEPSLQDSLTRAMAHVYSQNGDLDSARMALQRWRETRTGAHKDDVSRAWVLVAIGEFDEAVDTVQAALAAGSAEAERVLQAVNRLARERA